MKCAKIILCSGVIGLSSFALSAQQNTNSSGGEAIGSGGLVSYSVGLAGYSAQTGTNGSVEFGVQQSYSIITSLGKEIESIQLELTAYPNPVQNTLKLKVENEQFESLTYFLFDVNGKLLEEKIVTKTLTTIQVQHLAKSTYFLKIISNNQAVKTFNIIKN